MTKNHGSKQDVAWIGISSAIVNSREKVDRIANVDLPFLIQGNHGTGKSHLARYIHHKRFPNDSNFCLLEAEFWEDEMRVLLALLCKGKKCKKIANNHYQISAITLFWRNLQIMPISFQRRLNKLLLTGQYQEGDTLYTFQQVSYLFASTPELIENIRQEKFLEELYSRLHTVRFLLPDLQNRREDIAPLVNYYIAYYAQKYSKTVLGLSKDLTNFFLEYSWPGNVRQLCNLLETLVILYQEGELCKADIPDSFYQDSASLATRKLGVLPGVPLQEYEKAIILENLNFVGGNRARAADLLGISERTLYRKINSFGWGKGEV
ncbi:MAG: sigma 54-interacting transcriptional regulator [Spirochaetota bacterium]